MNNDGSTLRSRVVRVIVKPQTTYAKLVSSVERVLGDATAAETRGVLLAVASADGTREQIVASLGDVANLPPHATDLQLCAATPATSFRYIWAPTSLIGRELVVVSRNHSERFQHRILLRDYLTYRHLVGQIEKRQKVLDSIGSA